MDEASEVEPIDPDVPSAEGPTDAVEPPHDQAAEPVAAGRTGRRALVIALAVGVPLVLTGAVFAVLAAAGTFDEPEPPQLTASQAERIDAEFAEREDLLAELDYQRTEYELDLSDWTQSEEWTEEYLADTAQPTPSVPNPGGTALPGADPTGRAFLDAIGATDVTVFFEAGPDNCGYYGNGGTELGYAGGCFRPEYPNSLYMAWDPQAESVAWSIFVHEAMHWYQDEHYIQATYLADFAGVDFESYSSVWEADASCRAVYSYGMTLEDYVDTTSPCTIAGWYEGYITDYLVSRGANLTEPDPAAYEPVETSRP